ncbi:MAG: SDR family oxidoreductase [Deltaproteobacteria bacterium]|nr:SDR family oxidoreductase [Deltaproteobacteria bacterium]
MTRSSTRDTRRKTGIYRGGKDDVPIPGRARVVMVHDASRPIGRAVALALADRGQCVLACGEDGMMLADLPRETALGGVVEVSSARPGERVTRALSLFGRVDAVVAVAELEALHLFGRFGDQAAVTALELGLVAPMHFVQEASSQLTLKRRGRIVFVNALPALPLAAPAAAARAGIDGLAESLRLELLPVGIAVIVVAPEIAAPPPPSPTPRDALEAALAAMPAQSPELALAGPLRALVDQASTHAAIAAATVQALLEERPKPRLVVRAERRWSMISRNARAGLERAAAKPSKTR